MGRFILGIPKPKQPDFGLVPIYLEACPLFKGKW